MINKHIRVSMIIIFFSILPYTDITRPFHGVLLQKAIANTGFFQLQELSNADLIRKLIIIPEQVEDKESLVAMIGRINNIDRPILQLLSNQGVKIRLFEGRLTDEPLLYYLKWDQPRGWEREITWKDVPGAGGGWLVSAKIGASSPGNGHGSINLELHEIGHTVYRLLLTNPAFANDFKEAWMAEVEDMFPGKAYFQTYESEYFAEMFAYYYYSSNSRMIIEKKTPQTFSILKGIQSITIDNSKRYFYN